MRSLATWSCTTWIKNCDMCIVSNDLGWTSYAGRVLWGQHGLYAVGFCLGTFLSWDDPPFVRLGPSGLYAVGCCLAHLMSCCPLIMGILGLYAVGCCLASAVFFVSLVTGVYNRLLYSTLAVPYFLS